MAVRRLWLLILLAVAACAPGGINCDFVVVTKMPMETRSRLLVVPAGIGGQWITLLVDTGAERTILSEEAADRLGLKRDTRSMTRSVGMGGAFAAHDAIVPGLVLGGVRFPLERLPVGRFRFGSGLAADGVLGADVLLAFDLDLDVPGGQATLYRPRRCPDINPPWTEPAARIAGVRAAKDRLLIPMELDGITGMGILDTGAQATTIGLQMAKRLGLTAQSLSGDPIVRHLGAGPGSQDARLHRFATLKIGPRTIDQPMLSVLSVDVGTGDGLVGEDFIDGRRLWMSFSTREIFIAASSGGAPR